MDSGTAVRLVIAEDQVLLREGLRAMLLAVPAYEVAGEADDGRGAVWLTEALHPDLVILDLSKGPLEGLMALAAIKRTQPQTRVLVLTTLRGGTSVVDALQAGADGFLVKDGDRTEFLDAVACVLRGEVFLSPVVTEQVVTAFLRAKAPPAADPYAALSAREREVLKLVAEGYRTREIARYLCISPKTVEKHRGSLMNRLGLHSASALTAFAVGKGLITDH
jgi:DNA-binding NarL/FixJ family response regulator